MVHAEAADQRGHRIKYDQTLLRDFVSHTKHHAVLKKQRDLKKETYIP